MEEPNAEELARKIEHVDWLQHKILVNLNKFKKDLETDSKSWCCANSSRATFKIYRILLQKELINLEKYIYRKGD